MSAFIGDLMDECGYIIPRAVADEFHTTIIDVVALSRPKVFGQVILAL